VTARSEDIEEEFRERVGKRPVVVMLHGGPHGSHFPVLGLLGYSLLKMGYALLYPNIPGSTSHGQEYLQSQLGGIG
jgi:acylaminoacyl-peptidase